MGHRNHQVFKLLKEQKKKKKDMAIALGISPSAVTQWEKYGTDPTLEQCLVLAKFFNVEISKICVDKETADLIEGKETQTVSCEREHKSQETDEFIMTTDKNKEILAENIKLYMNRKGVTKQQLCGDLDFKYSTFVDWINAVTYPRMPKIEAMANYFEVKKSDLIEEQKQEMPTYNRDFSDAIIKDKDFAEIFEGYKSLNKEDKQMVKNLIRRLANEQ